MILTNPLTASDPLLPALPETAAGVAPYATPFAEPYAEPYRAPAPTSRERRLDRDLTAARQVQRALLPALEQSFEGVEVTGEYRPAYEVGGDFVEINRRRDGRTGFVVGDVAGNGVTAALIMARVSCEIRQLAARGRKPSRLLAGLNRFMNEQALPDRFVTATAIELDLDREIWIVANAGHPPALLLRKDGAVVLLGERGGPGLGFAGLAPWRCRDQVVPARPDDVLLAFTDGLGDRVSTSDFTELAAGPMTPDGMLRPTLAELKRRVFERMAAVAGAADDATLLAVRVLPAALRRC